MTDQAAKKQIENIKKVTAEAIKSKESARQILLDAGILKQEKKHSPPVNKTTK